MTTSQRFAAVLVGGILLGIAGGYATHRLISPGRSPRLLLRPTGTISDSGSTSPPSTASSPQAAPSNVSTPTTPAEPSSSPAVVTQGGKTFETSVRVDGVGKILVQVVLPKTARYSDGAPVIVNVPTSFTPEISGFHPLDKVEDEGVISVSLMYPGRSDGSGRSSEGADDFGGENAMRALRDVTLFALGKKTDSDGHALAELSAITPDPSDVGLYAFSHPGIIATTTLAKYAADLQDVRFFVGRENPTLDLLSTLELGHWNGTTAVINPLYSYPSDYSSTGIGLDYASVAYDAASASPYFDANGNKTLDSTEFSLGTQVPKMFGKRYYSAALLKALRDNGALTDATWPSDLASPETAATDWALRQQVSSYPALSALPNLHVMLVFAVKDHVQTAKDKPHIHQAFDGFRGAGLWTRLNPDASYVNRLNASIGAAYAEHEANAQPSDWTQITSWAFQGTGTSNAIVPIAGVLEMADRSHANNWSTNLSSVLQ